MSARALWGLLVALLAAGGAGAVPAPGLTWRTVRTACCDVHFHEEVRFQGERVAAMADESVALVSALLNHAPEHRVQIVVSEATDNLNGFATSLPYNLVQIFAVPPSRNEDLTTTEDSVRLVLVHELLHIIHLDTIHGLPRVVNWIFGRTWPPNFILPRWIHEGMAVYAESRFTAGGRLRSARWSAYLRQAALAGDLWSLDDVSNFSRRPPGGTAAYLYGGAFIHWLTTERGEPWLAKFNHDYAGRLIPYSVDRSVFESAGVHLDEAWADFQDDLRARARAKLDEIEARGGPTRARRLTRIGGSVDRPRLVGETLYFTATPPNGAPAIYAVDGLPGAPSRARPVARLNGRAELDVIAPGRFLVSQVEWTRDWWTFRDLFIIDDEGVRRLTHGERLRGPAVAPGGERAFAVRVTSTGSALVEVDLETGALREVCDFGRAVAYGPAVRPDGRAVVVSLRREGGARDLVLVDVPTGARRDLTRDEAEDTDPVFAPDGETLVFASDRDGVFNLYTLDPATGAQARLTDLVGGAHAPLVTPDGRALLYVDRHLDGSDVYAAPFSPRPLRGERVRRVEPAFPDPPELRLPEPKLEPERAYNPLETLFPRAWIPIFASDNLGGPLVGLSVVGSDAVETQSLNLSLTYGFADQRPSVGLTWRFFDTYLPLSLSAAWGTTLSDARRTSDGEPELHVEQLLRLSGSLSLPLRRFIRSHNLSLGYTRDLRLVETKVTGGADGVEPVLPDGLNVGALTARWSYRENVRYRDTSATDYGLNAEVRARLANAYTLSEVDVLEITTDISLFRPIPGLVGHSAGVYLSGGFSQGPRAARTRYFLGGLDQRDLLSDLVDGFRFGGGNLRGFRRNSVAGDGFAFGSLEYRLPLLAIERGFGTAPVQISRAHLALFTDLGDAFQTLPQLDDLHVGVGAELRMQLTFGYYGVLLIRGGLARGLTRGGIEQPYLVLGVPY